MGKLIELLNEYDKINEYDNKWFRNEYGCLDREYSWATVSSSCWKVISKEFGFIKWLVENDKIDKKKIDTRLVRNVESHYDEDGYWVENSYEDYSDTDTLLMLLSISNSPIEDLLLYLK